MMATLFSEKLRLATHDTPEASWPQTRKDRTWSSTPSKTVLMLWLQWIVEYYLGHGTF
ncbi:hypothetical protein BHE74_00022346 [Ensete ventricosum]|nr:hypothetical protein BHE74_00022346 [Ensete ventricosum]RZR84743.1 hypothetical protein BHM03_00011613 [Ensete ventricosum]